MELTLQNIGKRFKREWIFKNINVTIFQNDPLAILGSNGSGKSTLLQLVSGAVDATEGNISYSSLPDPSLLYKQVSIASPYMELIEEFTLVELAYFHNRFKPFIGNITVKEFVMLTGLESSQNKQIKYFSSGMKQRVKLALAILSNTKILLLDEPCSNLDSFSISWYQSLIKEYTIDRIVIIASNYQLHEYHFCKKELLLKKK